MTSSKTSIQDLNTIELKGGLTWRSIVALIFACVVLLPAAIFLYSVGGAWLAGICWIVVLLWSEMARIFGSPLTKQEMFIVYSVEVFLSTTSLTALGLIRQGYTRFSTFSIYFGLRDLIPIWFAPLDQKAFLMRSFLSPDWILPISVLLISTAISSAGAISLGYFTYYLYGRIEKLPFPVHAAAADAINSIAEAKEERLKIIIITAIIGMTYGGLVYLLPLSTGMSLTILPIPWFDLNQIMDIILPGAALGIATDIVHFAMGFILPIRVIVWILIGSITTFTFGNHILVRLGIWQTWAPGSTIQLAWQQSFISFWMFPIVGISIVGALLPLVRYPQNLIQSIRSLSVLGKSELLAGLVSAKKLLFIYLSAMIGNIILVYYLIPDIPSITFFYLAVIIIGFNFIWTLISSTSLGLAGRTIQIPYLYQAIMIGSGCKNPAIWFLPGNIISDAGAGWCGYFKLAELTGTKLSDYVKAWIIAAVLGLAMSFLYTQALWSMAEMPSSVFPWLQTYWPIETLFTLWWADIGITGKTYLNPLLIVGAAVIVTVIYFLSEIIRFPFSLVGLVVGVTTPPPSPISQFTGALIARYVLARIFGKERWNQYASAVFAGLVIGEGIMIVISSAISLILKSLWILPY